MPKDKVLITSCPRLWREYQSKEEYQRCAGRENQTECETTPSGKESSCVWVNDPKGPQGSYCRGSSEVIRL